MNLVEFFNCFYSNNAKGSLINFKAKEKIPQFFMEIAVRKESYYLLPESLNAFGKWFSGDRSPKDDVWSAIIAFSNKEGMICGLNKTLSADKLDVVASNFGISIPKGEHPDKECLAISITEQFYEIAAGRGIGDDIAKVMYKPAILTFPSYVKKAVSKYSKTKTPFTDDEERLLDDVYVCNSISSRSSNSRSYAKTVFTTNEITLEKIKEYSNKTILIGNAGMGKSIMLTYLFLHSIKKHETTGILPILAELREFSYGSKTVMDYLLEAVTHFDDSFNDKILIKLLEQGKCQILLDGMDEIDPSDANTFHKQLLELVDKYPNNQYVLASRECQMIRVTGFGKLYLQPFDDDKKAELIDKLLTLPEDENTKIEIKKFLKDQFIKNHCVFATNPMLLTFVVAKHPIIKTFNNKESLFYKEIYETIIYGHDKSKPNYSRIFHSVKDGDEFTTAFREFCALTYLDNINEFDSSAFEKYFKKIKSKNEFENPHKFNKNNFLRDTCATSCMLYEQQSKLLYIDEGFQALLAAEHLMYDEQENVLGVGNKLAKKKNEDYNSFKGFDYFVELDLEKVENCFFLPYLSQIFKDKDEEDSFYLFLKLCYKDLKYNNFDSVIKKEFENKVNVSGRSYLVNSSSNVIYTMLLKHLMLTGDFIFDGFPYELDFLDYRVQNLYGEIINAIDKIDIKPASIPGNIDYFEKTASADKYLFKDEKPLIVGYEYTIPFIKIENDKEKFNTLIRILKTQTKNINECYKALKKFYDTLKEKYSQY